MSKSINDIVIDLLNVAASIQFDDPAHNLAMQDDIRALAATVQRFKDRAAALEVEIAQAHQHNDELVLALANEAATIRAAAIENSRKWLIREMEIETSLDGHILKALIDVLTGNGESPIGKWDREELLAAIERASEAVALASEKSHHGMDDEIA